MDSPNRQKVVVVGAGPVGALAALYAAERGDDVELYELRGDLRDPSTTPLNFTKSINLALSERGINAMRHARYEGLIDSILQETIPMHARMIHGRGKTGSLYEESQEYDVHGRSIKAVDRAGLNKRLLDALESMPNVIFKFNHKLTGADFKKKIAWFEKQTQAAQTDHAQNPTQSETPKVDNDSRPPEVEVTFDLLIGADGAHSAARFHMMKYARLNYQQEYIDTLWCEFHIPPSTDPFSSSPSEMHKHAISPNHLHIWPGGPSLMFIAIPSLDKSFTCTLFAPSSTFTHLSSDPASLLLPFFTDHFPGVSPQLITASALQSQFSNNPHLPLISIKCTPYHFNDSVVILGDAAHAMVPFYGQGMNAGLEDVRVLFEFLDRHGVYQDLDYDHPHSTTNITKEASNTTHQQHPEPNTSPSPSPLTPQTQTQTRSQARTLALKAYTSHRTPDAHTINDLALQNYTEMSSSVTSPLYRLRKSIEEYLSAKFPRSGFRTQYSRVSFGNQRYSVVKEVVGWQGRMLWWGVVGGGVGVGWVFWWVLVLRRRWGVGRVR
ncbi:kynurenine 3-monooxygenase, mitochondrial precursor [Bachmanniomyces sp. S44760]|nr:kynurenine 3-monooxygenase, mitochondrial precursor [Bachmanniomyces sp. S44760]